MKRTQNTKFRLLYGSVVCAGWAIFLIAGYRLIYDHAPVAWIVLSLLTLVAGSLSLKIPGVNGRVSLGDTLICLSVLLFGPLAGAVTAAFEGIAGSLRCRTSSRRVEFMLFNGGAMSLSAYAAGKVFFAAHGQQLLHGHITASPLLPGSLMALAVTYFAANTLLVAAASALDRSAGIFQTWRNGFLWTGVNYLAAAFISGTLAQSLNPMALPALATLAIGFAGVYLSARAYIRLAQKVQDQAKQAQPAAHRMVDIAVA